MSLPNDYAGHGQMSSNPEAHDYLGFGQEHSTDQPTPAPQVILVEPPEELLSLSVNELCKRYYECVRNCTLAEQQRVERNLPSITTSDSPKLVTARQIYAAWQVKASRFRSVRAVDAG